MISIFVAIPLNEPKNPILGLKPNNLFHSQDLANKYNSIADSPTRSEIKITQRKKENLPEEEDDVER